MFIDEASFTIHAGKGGDGAVSFRRERFVPKGGPDGGDGGDGGNVVFVGKHDVHTLSFFRAKKMFKAEDGQNGMHKKMHGKNGDDYTIEVPLGTVLYIKYFTESGVTNIHNETNKVEILEDGQVYVAARGGNGGWGNMHFATSIKQAPEWSKQGLPGQSYEVHLELQLIADVGLVGMPNAGKSTFLATVTNAKPKIADYPFTTLEPQLGVATISDNHIVIADIPGLIEGAAENKGLGHDFLKHIKRTKALLYLIDVNDEDPKKTYSVLQNELKQFDESLAQKHSILAFTKTDSASIEAIDKVNKEFKHAYFISAPTGKGVKELLYALAALASKDM